MSTSPTRHDEGEQTTPTYGQIDDLDLKATAAQLLDRWPCAGLAVAVIRNGGLAWFHGHGLADVAAKTPITEDTVFRIASLTKTFTAVAVMQLWEQGLVDLDAPANDYLRAFRLIPTSASLRPATVGHLLTHTAGVVIGGGYRICFSRASVRASERHDRGRSPLRPTIAGACLWKLSRGPSGCTATTGSPHSGRSSRM
jgi:CubicO group peptidase (beta-lactamase class C family)